MSSQVMVWLYTIWYWMEAYFAKPPHFIAFQIHSIWGCSISYYNLSYCRIHQAMILHSMLYHVSPYLLASWLNAIWHPTMRHSAWIQYYIFWMLHVGIPRYTFQFHVIRHSIQTKPSMSNHFMVHLAHKAFHLIKAVRDYASRNIGREQSSVRGVSPVRKKKA